MSRILIITISVLSTGLLYAQTNLSIVFPPKVGGQDLQLNTTVQDLNGTDMSITDFQYYLSNLEILHDGGQSLVLDTVLFVQTAGDNFSFYLGQFDVTNVEQVNFGVGVPLSLNHEDISLYPTDHPLSWQTPSMHWGWTSGYKFMLCDGFGDNTGNGTPNELFQLHNLGDANYKNVELPVTAHNDGSLISIVINCNLDEWLFGADPATVGVEHNTIGINAAVMNNVNTRSVFEAPADAGINEESVGSMSVNMTSGGVNIFWKDVIGSSKAFVYDAAGKMVKQYTELNNEGTVNINSLGTGTYFFYLKSKENIILNSVQFFQ